jgi:hypothetical protein
MPAFSCLRRRPCCRLPHLHLHLRLHLQPGWLQLALRVLRLLKRQHLSWHSHPMPAFLQRWPMQWPTVRRQPP